MAKPSTPNASSGSTRGRWIALLTLTLLIISVTLASAQVPYVPPGSIYQNSWDPKKEWTFGLNAGLREGQTAPIAFQIAKEAGKTYRVALCIQVVESPFKGAYGFTAFEPFDKSFSGTNAIVPPPTHLPPDTPKPGPDILPYASPPWDKDHPFVWGYNITIHSVTDPAMPIPKGPEDVCDPNELQSFVEFTVDPEHPNDAYIVFGAHIAAVGDPIPPGAPEPPGMEDGVVSLGESATFMIGNFQARMATPAGDKTLPFKAAGPPLAVALSGFEASAVQALPYGLSLLALAGLGAAGFAYRRRKQR